MQTNAHIPYIVFKIRFFTCYLRTDINECSQHDPAGAEYACGAVVNGRCVNTDGSYRCECEDGYVKVENNNEGFYCEPGNNNLLINLTRYCPY